MNGCCRGLPAKVCFERNGCGDDQLRLAAGDRAFAALIDAAGVFAPHVHPKTLKFKFRTEHGMIYVSIGFTAARTDDFHEVTP